MPTRTADDDAPATNIAIEMVDPRTLVFADYNPRQMTSAKRARLAASISGHGFVDPVIARREDRLILGGHQRTDVAINQLRLTLVPVVFLDGVSDARAKAMNIALNNQELQGEFDLTKLSSLVKELDQLDGFDLGLTGFDDAGIANILNYAPPTLVPPERTQEQPALKSERLVEVRCDDATLNALVLPALERLMEHPGVTVNIT